MLIQMLTAKCSILNAIYYINKKGVGEGQAIEDRCHQNTEGEGRIAVK